MRSASASSGVDRESRHTKADRDIRVGAADAKGGKQAELADSGCRESRDRRIRRGDTGRTFADDLRIHLDASLVCRSYLVLVVSGRANLFDEFLGKPVELLRRLRPEINVHPH